MYITDGMSHPGESQQLKGLQIALRISQEMDDELLQLAQRWERTMTLDTRVGKTTIAREALKRGMRLIDEELTAIEAKQGKKKDGGR